MSEVLPASPNTQEEKSAMSKPWPTWVVRIEVKVQLDSGAEAINYIEEYGQLALDNLLELPCVVEVTTGHVEKEKKKSWPTTSKKK